MEGMMKVQNFIVMMLVMGVASLSAASDDAKFSLPDDIGTGKVLGIHYYTLKEGVDPAVFEKFVTGEWAPVVSELFPGVKLMLMKGERGTKINTYILAFEISSLYVRNFYWPQSGESTDAAKAIFQDCDKCRQVWDKMSEMAKRTEWTDYVALTRK
jgi:hypothetical protein